MPRNSPSQTERPSRFTEGEENIELQPVRGVTSAGRPPPSGRGARSGTRTQAAAGSSRGRGNISSSSRGVNPFLSAFDDDAAITRPPASHAGSQLPDPSVFEDVDLEAAHPEQRRKKKGSKKGHNRTRKKVTMCGWVLVILFVAGIILAGIIVAKNASNTYVENSQASKDARDANQPLPQYGMGSGH